MSERLWLSDSLPFWFGFEKDAAAVYSTLMLRFLATLRESQCRLSALSLSKSHGGERDPLSDNVKVSEHLSTFVAPTFRGDKRGHNVGQREVWQVRQGQVQERQRQRQGRQVQSCPSACPSFGGECVCCKNWSHQRVDCRKRVKYDPVGSPGNASGNLAQPTGAHSSGTRAIHLFEPDEDGTSFFCWGHGCDK